MMKIPLLFATAAALATGTLGAAPSTRPGAAPLRLEVDVSERKLYVHQGGEVVRTYSVAVGQPEHPTPRGDFTIRKLIWDPGWVPPPDAEWAEDEERKEPSDPDNPMEAVKIYFQEPDYYIHGTNAVESLGTAASHGCVRMDPSDAENLAIRIMEHGGEARSDAWYERMIRQEEKSHTVTLRDPVPLEIHD
jgi:lipoprotein-anchoring transpeptidase ErfK/SrfK